MGTTLNCDAYQRLIDEDLAWLEKQPRSLEREHIKDIVRLSPSREYSNPATTPPDFTEQARQLALKISGGANLNNVIAERAIRDIASFAAEAATQGQVAGIERAVQACEKRVTRFQEIISGRDKSIVTDVAEFRKAEATTLLENIRTLSPDPSLLDQVRNEARAALLAELSDSATEIDEKFMDDLACGFIPSNERHAFYSHVFGHLEQRLAAVAYKAATAALEQERKRIVGILNSKRMVAANPAVHRGRIAENDLIDEVIAAIGDDKGQQ